MSSKNERKRKQEIDTSVERDKTPEKNHKLQKDKNRSKKTRTHDRSEECLHDSNGRKGEETLSIKETNKLRAKLGLAPLELDDSQTANTTAQSPQIILGKGEELFKEDGVSIVHKAPKNISQDKLTEKVKEKIETLKQRRKIESKILKVKKGLADSDSEEDSAAWVERNRRIEEERKKAKEKAKMLDELDEAFSIGGLIEEEKKKLNKNTLKKKKEDVLTAGLIVGHSKDAFVDGKETVLVLKDKGILDEDDEVLINPNLVDDEHHKRNVELRKASKKGYKTYEDDESFDEYGQLVKKNILDKYDNLDEIEKKQETFKLDASGSYDLEKQTFEEEVKRKLMMANKNFESLECAKPSLAREFYTDEEMILFRRSKKKKDSTKLRKRKVLKASDIINSLNEDDGLTAEERRLRAEKLSARRGTCVENNLNETENLKESVKLEEGELEDDQTESKIQSCEKWKKTSGGSVDIKKLKELAEKVDNKEVESSESEEELINGVDLTGIVLEDEAEDELNMVLQRTRRLKQAKVKKEINAEQVYSMISSIPEIKEECIEENEENEITSNRRKIVFDATSEQYKAIGEIPTLGLAGNRQVGIDYSTIDEDLINYDNIKTEPEEKRYYSDLDSDEDVTNKEKLRKKKKQKQLDEEKSNWNMNLDTKASPCVKEESNSEDSDDALDRYENVLGEEKDVSKGVAAMLKLAGVKGYLENSNGRRIGDRTLKHLESKRFSKIEQGRYDIEDKTMRKLERMGTTGTGPVRAFPEKKNYKPDVEVTYADKDGRLMSSKEAFRVLSWKFHGKGPGKKQIEKHQAQLEKKERLKKMNSMDTPLGTLSKQRKKQEQLQTPYLVLSGMGKDFGAPLQKD